MGFMSGSLIGRAVVLVIAAGATGGFDARGIYHGCAPEKNRGGRVTYGPEKKGKGGKLKRW